MKIKHIIKSQRLRHSLMRLGKFLPDDIMLTFQYKLLLGRWPNFKNPKRFTEWIQYLKIHYRNPEMFKCVDKFAVREFVAHRIGETYLTKVYFKCKDAHEIKFDDLPQKFVIKTTSGGNGDNVLIVGNKSNIDINSLILKVNRWKKKDYSDTSREWAYQKAASDPEIIVEEYIEHDPKKGLDDYKFFCYNGKCRYFKVDFNRFTNHRANYYNSQGELLPIEEVPFHPDPEHYLVPLDDLNKMIDLAEKLSKGFPFVRVDLYNPNGKIYFGELTFYPGSGYGAFKPDSFDFEAGSYFPPKNDEIWTKYMHAGK